MYSTSTADGIPALLPGPASVMRRALRLALPVLLSFAAVPGLAEAPIAVNIVTAQSTPYVQRFSVVGDVAARYALSASFPHGGRIAEVSADVGDSVTKGTVLARLETVQQEQALRAAEAGFSTAEADYKQAVEDFEREQALLERGATTRTSRDDAEDALRIADGVLARAQADLDQARKALEDAVLVAPSDATIVDRLVDPGQVVGAAQPVFDLALGSEVDALFDVPEVLMSQEASAPENVTLDLVLIDHPDTKLRGMVRQAAPLVDPTTGTVEVKVSIIDPPDFVSYGDTIRGTVAIKGTSRVILPYTVLAATADGPAVWIVDPETMGVSLRGVSIDRFETGRIVLADGVEDGMLVVTNGAQFLYPGRVVRQAEGGQ